MGRGRASFGSSRSSKKVYKEESRKFENGVVDEETWYSSKHYGSFIVPDPSDKESEGQKFGKGDIVTVLPNDKSPTDLLDQVEYWIGQIKEVRASLHDADTNSVYLKVQWFYSATDTGRVIQSFNQAAIGQYERINSDDWDFVLPESLNEKVTMHKFDENDPEQAYIPRNEFYYRYTLESRSRLLTPKQSAFGCTCMRPYDLSDDDLMHFCPRPQCRRAYHQNCLLRSGSIEKEEATSEKRQKKSVLPTNDNKLQEQQSQRTSRALRLLACSPDTDDEIDLESLISHSVVHCAITSEGPGSVSDTEDQQPPKKRRRTRSSLTSNALPASAPASRTRTKSKQQDLAKPSLSSILNKIPPQLLQIAQQPLVRGAAFALGGISGNIGFVTRARRLVYQILEGNTNLSDKWEAVVFPPPTGNSNYGVQNAIVKISGSKKALPPVICPHCRSAI